MHGPPGGIPHPPPVSDDVPESGGADGSTHVPDLQTRDPLQSLSDEQPTPASEPISPDFDPALEHAVAATNTQHAPMNVFFIVLPFATRRFAASVAAMFVSTRALAMVTFPLDERSHAQPQ